MTRTLADTVSAELPDPIVVVDSHDGIAWFNRAFGRLVPRARIGKPLSSVLQGVSRDLASILSLARFSTEPMPCRVVVRGGGGGDDGLPATHWRLRGHSDPMVCFRLLIDEGGATQFIVLTETIDRLNREIDNRRRAEDSLREAIARLEIASRVKDRVLAEVSHDLRTPLNAIIGFADAMRQGLGGELNDAHQDYVTAIHSSGQVLLSLVDQILLAAAGDRGSRDVAARLTDLGTCLDRCVAAVTPMAEAKHLRILIPDGMRLPTLRVEQSAVTTILMNLLGNAAKFSPSGSAVTVAARRQSDDGLEICVRDEGPGIPRDEIDRVTMPFYKASSADRTTSDGHGLGLAIVARRLEEIGASMRIDSGIGRGTAVTVSIPPALVGWEASISAAD